MPRYIISLTILSRLYSHVHFNVVLQLHLVGLDLFTSKRYEDIRPVSHKLQVPLVSKTDYQV